ncbi:Hypp1280 [Branchiostoma lanceolatum]|uniref:Hypp1280 protein n=1 Tax=Branchiostoma lanceolatum TaxID=7740 RepID=A0A8K0EHY7_BRALA|nr:Hypp1280 [Branchiostoma lanceolatum]
MRLASLVLLLLSWFTFAANSIDLEAAGQYRCSFDAGVCGWTVEGPVYHGGPAGCDHGWPNDAVHGATAPGMYACFFLESLPAPQYQNLTRARLTSPTINTTHHVVMSFAVGTVRPPTSTYLNVILVNETGTETLLCSTSELLSPWQRIYVGVVQPGPYKIVIEGIPDPPFYPNFGIDDLTMTAVENDTTTMPMTSSHQKTRTPAMNTKQEETANTVSSFQTTNHFHPTTSQAETTSGISKNPTSKTTPQEETTKHPITSKSLLTTFKSGEVPTKSLPTNTTSKEGQLGQQSGRNSDPDITALPIVLGIAGFLLIAAGAMFYLRKIRKKSSFSVEESRRVSMMSLTYTELTEL